MTNSIEDLSADKRLNKKNQLPSLSLFLMAISTVMLMLGLMAMADKTFQPVSSNAEQSGYQTIDFRMINQDCTAAGRSGVAC